MKIRVAEATGVTLDWMVAKAEGHFFVDVHGRGACRFPGVQTKNKRGGYELMPLRLQSTMKTAADADYPGVFFSGTRYWQPSTDWSQGGPIIERESLSVIYDYKGRRWCAAFWHEHLDFFDASLIHGPTPLIAAMRAYVASRLGGEVEVPEGLT